MTLSAAANRVSYAGDGTTTSFAFAFTLWAASEVKVYLVSSTGVQTLKTITTHYTLSTSTFPAASLNVTMVTAPATGETLVLVRSQALSQALDLVNGDPLPSDLIERRFDILTGIIQNLSERVDRALSLPVGSSLANLTYEAPAAAADGYAIVWDDGGEAFILASALDTTEVTVSAFGQTLIDDANAAAALTTLGVSAFVQTLLDDADAGTFQTTLGISAFVKTLLNDASASAFFATLGVLSGNATIDFASVADNASSAASTVTVTGAAVGDLAFATSNGNIMTTAGVWLLAKVTAADTVSVQLHNDSAGAFDAASQTVYAFVIPKASFGQ